MLTTHFGMTGIRKEEIQGFVEVGRSLYIENIIINRF